MKRQTWLVTGSTGLVGRTLTQLLLDQGQVVHTLDRKKRKRLSPDHHAFAWPTTPDAMDNAIAQGVDVVVHLAGASVGQRWTRSHKEAILRSRVEGTTALMQTLNEASFAGTILQASAIGLYEPSEHPMDEQGAPGSSFLADVVKRWEQAACDNQPQGSRLVFLRLGIVLAPKGGTLDKLAPIYRMGLGAPLAFPAGRLGACLGKWPPSCSIPSESPPLCCSSMGSNGRHPISKKPSSGSSDNTAPTRSNEKRLPKEPFLLDSKPVLIEPPKA